MAPCSKTKSRNSFGAGQHSFAWLSCLYFDAFPEGYVVLDFGCGGFGVRVIPGGVFVFHSVDFQIVIVCGAFPGAFAGVGAGLEKFLLHRAGGKILVSFHYDATIAIRDDFSTPSCFWHFVPPKVFCALEYF